MSRDAAVYGLGDHKVYCGICGAPGGRGEMVHARLEAPGHPPTPMLVHRECYDEPSPRSNPPRPRPVRPPDRVQAQPWTDGATSSTPTLTLAAQVGTTLTLTGTNFNSTTRARVDGHHRTTTYVSATELSVSLAAEDVTAGDHAVQVWHLRPPPDPDDDTFSNVVTYTV